MVRKCNRDWNDIHYGGSWVSITREMYEENNIWNICDKKIVVSTQATNLLSVMVTKCNLKIIVVGYTMKKEMINDISITVIKLYYI